LILINVEPLSLTRKSGRQADRGSASSDNAVWRRFCNRFSAMIDTRRTDARGNGLNEIGPPKR
jgi:hypothetical protein